MNANLDTGASVDLSLVKFDREGVGDGSSCDWITEVEGWRFQGTDAHQLLGSNASAFATAPAALDAHEVLCSAAEIACKEQQDFHVGDDGGHMSLIHSKIGQGMRNHFGKMLNEYGMSDLIPFYLEKEALNFYMDREVKSEEIHSVNEAERRGRAVS